MAIERLVPEKERTRLREYGNFSFAQLIGNKAFTELIIQALMTEENLAGGEKKQEIADRNKRIVETIQLIQEGKEAQFKPEDIEYIATQLTPKINEALEMAYQNVAKENSVFRPESFEWLAKLNPNFAEFLISAGLVKKEGERLVLSVDQKQAQELLIPIFAEMYIRAPEKFNELRGKMETLRKLDQAIQQIERRLTEQISGALRLEEAQRQILGEIVRKSLDKKLREIGSQQEIVEGPFIGSLLEEIFNGIEQDSRLPKPRKILGFGKDLRDIQKMISEKGIGLEDIIKASMGQETNFQNFVDEIKSLRDTINSVCEDLKKIFTQEGGKFFSLLLVKGVEEGIKVMETQGKSLVGELEDLRQFEEEWRRAEEGRREEILNNKANEIKNRGPMIMKLAELALGKDLYEILFKVINQQQK
jgi:hypothetical protein